jgi:hypothetical protein
MKSLESFGGLMRLLQEVKETGDEPSEDEAEFGRAILKLVESMAVSVPFSIGPCTK